MKIRNGFVSNSSSSSFIVPARIYDMDSDKWNSLLTQEEIKKLEEYGFKWIKTDDPFQTYYCGIDNSLAITEEEKSALAFDIGVNQEDVAYFLTRELNVSFEAAVHYAHWYWTYLRGGTNIECIPNHGIERQMYTGSVWEDPRFASKQMVRKIKDIEPPMEMEL